MRIILSIMLIICSICLLITTFLYLKKQNHVKNLLLRIMKVEDENYKLRNDNLNLRYDVDLYKIRFEKIEEILKLVISTTENNEILIDEQIIDFKFNKDKKIYLEHQQGTKVKLIYE